MAAGNITAPDDLTEDVIKETKGVNRLSKLAQQFSPPVSTENCMTANEMRERVMCAWRKARLLSTDLDDFGEMMEQLKETDGKMRSRLTHLFEQTRELLSEVVKLDKVIDKQLQQEDNTRDYDSKIRTFMKLLQQEECPVVVAGQVSSGKSTLLNLFLGEELLPSQLLSCTATICELVYAESNKAEILLEDGSHEPIPFEDKNSYIFKSSEREKRFDHEAVRLHMPVPFLKSGITLVDTPGVGENKEMWEVLTDYVTKKNVFGFIFAIKCDDSGGILSRFKEMLRQLSMIKDEQGQYKFDPKSVIFVANFWDKVKDDDKPTVQKSVEEALTREPCLNGIDIENQLFFVNSKFAWSTWQVGLISEDYEKLIRAVERFFPIGHKRKLKLAYTWLENLLLRVQHPVQAFLNKAETSAGLLDRNTGQVLKKLFTTEQLAKDAKEAFKEFFEATRKQLMDKVEKYLQLEVTRKKITTWSPRDIPKEEYADSWVLIEERLDQVIDERVSLVLQEWEVDVKNFERAEKDILDKLRHHYAIVFTNVAELEKMLRDMSGEKQDSMRRPSSVLDELPDAKPREFKVDVAHEFSEMPVGHQILNNLLYNPAALFKMGNTTRQKMQQKHEAMYQENKVKYLEQRSGLVFSRLRESEQTIRQIVDGQLHTVEKSTDIVYSDIMGLIASNRTLASELQNDKRESPQLEKTYRPVSDQLNEVLEQTISFMYETIHDYDFPCDAVWKSKTSQVSSSVVSKMSQLADQTKKTKKEVIAKQLQTGSAFKRRHLFTMAGNMRALNKYRQAKDYIPVLLGTALYQGEPALILDGCMTSARQHMLTGRQGGLLKRAFYINNDVKKFIMDVSKAVEFLHLKRLVHVDLSLDSVMVQDGIPKLTNIFESMEIQYPGDKDTLAGNYVYMAPETFPVNGRKRYSCAADVYALGLMLLELWAQCDLYRHNNGPKDWRLQDFVQEQDPGAILLQRNEQIPGAQKHLPQILLKKCLCPSAKARLTVSEWINELKEFNKMNFRFE